MANEGGGIKKIGTIMVRSKAQRSKEMIHDTFRGLSNLGIRCQDSFCWSKKKRNRPHPQENRDNTVVAALPVKTNGAMEPEKTHNTGFLGWVLLDGIFRQSKKTVGNVSRWHRWHRAEGLTPCLLKAVSSDDKPRDP